tara:strand:+ start:1389 stop:1808 length:420 start_codon:yes stop_codon:yes gene_type:complete
MTTRNDITGDPIKTKGRLSEEGRDNWDRIFGRKKEDEVSYDPAANVGMLMTDYGASETLATEIEDHVRTKIEVEAANTELEIQQKLVDMGWTPPEEIYTTGNFARKMKEWELMYECLKSMHLYEYPVEEAKEVLKRIED